MTPTTEITISNRTIIRVVVIVTATILGFWLLAKLHTQMVWILTSAFLALALDPPVNRLSRYMPKKSRGLAVLIVLLAAVAVLAIVLVGLIPPFALQLFHLVTNLPSAYQQFTQSNPSLVHLLSSSFGTSSAGVQQFSHQLESFGGSAVTVLREFFGGLIAVGTVFVLTYFMVLEGPGWLEQLWGYAKPATRSKYQGLLQQMHGTITGYVNGNIVKSLIAVVASGIALIAVGSPFAFTLALLVGIVDLIPMVGATLAAITVCLVVLLFKGPTPAIILAIFFVIFQQLENYVFQPLIFKKTVEVSPLVTTLSLIIGASLAGFVGALVAIPVAASLQILLRFWLASRRNAKA